MAKLLYKTLLVSLVFFGTGFLIFYFGKAWDDTTLQATDGDLLNSQRWNTLVDKTSPKINISQVELTNSSDITVTNTQGGYNLPGMNISEFEVGPSGKVLLRLACSHKGGLPQFRVINSDGGTKTLGSRYASAGTNYSNVTGEILYSGFTPGSKQSFQLQVSNGTGTYSLVFTTSTQPNWSVCRMSAITY